jgi:Fe2+ transport system protein FeoA
MSLFDWFARRPHHPGEALQQAVCPLSEDWMTHLAKLPPGKRARVDDFNLALPADYQARLQAYGLNPGAEVVVLQHSPVVIVRIEELELAMEADLAEMVLVRRLDRA